MPVLVAAILTVAAAQLLDLATFVTMIRQLGPEAEANPLVAKLFGLYGYPAVAIAKIALLALVSSVVAVLAVPRMRPRLVAAVIAVAIVGGLVGGLSNSLAIGAMDAAMHNVGLGGP